MAQGAGIWEPFCGQDEVDPAPDMARAMRRPRPALLLTLALLAASLAPAHGQPWASLNNLFNKYHVDVLPSPGSDLNAYCTGMMRDRGIFLKPVHTFIHEPIPAINDVCSGGGTPIFGGLRRSIGFFSTTTCTYNPLSVSYSGTLINRKIVLACWNGLPVLYVE
ncbi:ribonuclease-like [Emydura macquarii macquarii]|uniref:ribonuclease-like n=1 Tax=Emydura macquarii macquarii TaxID=1129001 RepID=UPI00352A4585